MFVLKHSYFDRCGRLTSCQGENKNKIFVWAIFWPKPGCGKRYDLERPWQNSWSLYVLSRARVVNRSCTWQKHAMNTDYFLLVTLFIRSLPCSNCNQSIVFILQRHYRYLKAQNYMAKFVSLAWILLTVRIIKIKINNKIKITHILRTISESFSISFSPEMAKFACDVSKAFFIC